jgi:hypothetical protein
VRESPSVESVESPGKISKMKALRERLTEKVLLRNIDSVFLENDAKNVIVQSVFDQKPKASKGDWIGNNDYTCLKDNKVEV